MGPTYFKSAEPGARPGIQEERQWQMWDVTTERGERRNRLTRVQKEETGLQKSACLPLPPAPVVGTEDRDKPYAGPLLVPNRPELRKSPSWLSTHSFPSNLQRALQVLLFWFLAPHSPGHRILCCLLVATISRAE